MAHGYGAVTRSLAMAALAVANIHLLAFPVMAREPAFTGRIGKTYDESVPAWPAERNAPAGSPNVLIWMIDDLGFGQLGSYGGLIDTPNLDQLARQGLRYSNYHTTPICSASRAAFLTGRNPHRIHSGGHVALATGFPGYDARIPRAAGTIADNLRSAGYITYALGKWDHLPSEDASAAGPFTYWPSGQGFDRFYGFLWPDTNNFAPVLWSDHQPAPLTHDPEYHLTADLAEHAINWINARDAAAHKRPFLLYWATGATHAPHHAPEAYLKRYRGRFDMGWDKAREEVLRRQKALGIVPQGTTLPPRPESMPAWNSLSADQKRSYARAMEAFAAQLSHADAEFGRILAALKERGEFDNTLIVVTADNGASAEGGLDGLYDEHFLMSSRKPTLSENLKYYEAWGGPQTYPHYPMGWAVAGNTPFRYYKQTAYEGGTRVPLIVSWPKGIAAKGEIRTQYHHVTDLTPTILDSVKVAPAAIVHGEKQMSFDGASMVYSFGDARAPTNKQSQYYEMFGNRAVWAQGWKAVIPYSLKTWNFLNSSPITDKGWELYHVDQDINEQKNLAAAEPARLKSMLTLFDQLARANNVYPLTNISQAAQAKAALSTSDRVWTYKGAVPRIPMALAPPVNGPAFSLTANLELPTRANGVVMAVGGDQGGMSFYLLDGRPIFAIANINSTVKRIAAKASLPAGSVQLTLKFERASEGARIRIDANGSEIASGDIAGPLPVSFFSSSETMDIGSDSDSIVSPDYDGPNPLSGKIRQITIASTPIEEPAL
ncbi:putative arylsulfatase [Caenibius tardaugens NBRC 16725]|uniref:Putative arylsulfatase n=1 Tax=Caenibius tardaugens NBRC 16725 TaxID=1219035 RepID=U3A0E0_9SPHN|nr:arylsulfatase [Caenibius tardaugens]AZI35234.1 arylsulfatase [Caenibius tardaugens NBRC 16725]GAD51114.1 putative arylsulfatase [Caenibius tardaugens NBRC 16725]